MHYFKYFRKMILSSLICFFFFVVFPSCVDAADHVGMTLVQPFKVYSMYDLINLNPEVKSSYENFKTKMNEYCTNLYGEDYTYFNYYSTYTLEGLEEFYRKHEERITYHGACFADKKTKNSGIVNFDKFYNEITGSFYFETQGSYSSYYSYSKGADNLYTDKISDSYYRQQITKFMGTWNEFHWFIDSNHADYRITSVPEIWHSNAPNAHQYFDSFNINGVNYVPNDYIIRNLINSVPITVPKLLVKEVEHELNDDKTYKSKTLEFSFNNFDLTKYRYYFSNDNVMFFDFSTNAVRIKFSENTTIYFKVTDLNDDILETYFYELNDIGVTKYLDESLDLTGKGIPSLSDSDYTDDLDEETETVNGLLERFKKFFMGKFPIITQVQKIYEKWSAFNPIYNPDREILATVRCPRYGDVVYEPGGDPVWCDIVWSSNYRNKIPRLKIDFSFFKIDKEFEIVDMGVLLKHRDDYFKWIYLSLGTYTAFKVIDRVIRIIRSFKTDS